MFRCFILDFSGNWDEYLPLIEFTYNNSYQASIGMASYKFETIQVIEDITEKIHSMREKLKIVQSCQKSYVDLN